MVLVQRSLPWEQPDTDIATALDRLLAIHHDRHPDSDPRKIIDAYHWAHRVHDGQVRKSGEPYVQHPIEVATIVAKQGLDADSVAAAIMHDAVEDTDTTVAEIAENFGEDVASIIDGCTKVDRLKFHSKEQQKAATIQKLLVYVGRDLRVLVIKLADRLHNMRTLGVIPEWKQKRTAGETLHVFAPLAHRLGMEELRRELEDLSFAALHPRWYAEIDDLVAQKAPERDLYLTQLLGDLEARLAELSITAEVYGRSKHLWSIYEKMFVQGRGFDDIYDLIGVRVICESVKDCYSAIGCIHAHWNPVQGRFKDFIATPKFNLYQSLHATVVGPQGKTVEFQIRTREMDDRAERGMAAHWAYKDALPTRDLDWLNRVIDISNESSDPNSFMATLRDELEQEDVSVFTPKGNIVSLPAGSTALDFAYAIHTEVGNAAVGARVNGLMVALDHRLEAGELVEIITSKHNTAAPSEQWLEFAVTHRAQSNIRRWHNRERKEDELAAARDEVSTALRAAGLPVHEVMRSSTLTEIASEFGYSDPEALYTAVSSGSLNPKAVVSRAAKRLRGEGSEGEERVSTNISTSLSSPRRARSRRSAGVHVDGFPDVMVRLAKCCKPVPPDDVCGFVTRGRGVAVHRSDCLNAVPQGAGAHDRLVDAVWDLNGVSSFVASIEVRALDRMHLLVDVAQAMSNQDVNIIGVQTTTTDDRVAVMQFDFELSDAAQIPAITQTVRDIDGVYQAQRLLPTK